MDDTGPYQQMLASLRQNFSSRLPSGLTSAADSRLQRTLGHYIREVARVQGTINEQEVLRETFDSMAGWFRRNTAQLSPVFRQGAEPPRMPAPDMVEAAVAPDMVPGGGALSVIGERPWQDTDDDPIALFERLKAARGAIAPPSAPMSSPLSIPELQPLETRAKPPQPVQQKDFLQKQEDVVKYRDTEYNLIINSKDRDWIRGPLTQNRYHFSIAVDPTKPQQSGPTPTLMQRIRNIIRVEFVKAILPVESLEVVVPTSCTTGPQPTDAFYSVLALPSINVILDEMQGNNYGTNDGIDRSLAVCQYDATWRTDNYHSRTNTNRGYTLFFPKFMKAQRVYAPAPLSNFQRLSFQILGPENLPLSTCPDANQVEHVAWSSLVEDLSGSSSTCYNDPSGAYLYIKTRRYFPVWSYSQLDKILLGGLTFKGSDAATESAGAAAIEWLQRPEGHIVVGTAYGDISGGTPYLSDGANDCGYANWIIVRNRFTDPAENGNCGLLYFSAGGNDEMLAQELIDYPAQFQGGAVLNLSRQVQLVLRVVTRDYDPGSNLRPDNV
jgi:hypothetical protein